MRLVALSFLLFSLPAVATEVYFSPSPDCENRVVKAIDDAKSEITAAVYSINNRRIVEALIAAKKRGVKVRILTDAIQAGGKSSRALQLKQEGLDLRLNSKHKIEHNKFGVYDGALVSTGSFNWTGPAARSNSENCLFLKETDVVAKYKERFDFLWDKNTEDGSLARITKLKERQARAR